MSRVENVGKGEDSGYQQCFQNLSGNNLYVYTEASENNVRKEEVSLASFPLTYIFSHFIKELFSLVNISNFMLAKTVN